MGRVFRAEDLQLARQVALKVISLSSHKDKPLRSADQAISEARLAAALEHPNIVHVYEVDTTSNLCYIAMELVEGGNLKDLVRGSGPMDYVRACQLVAEAAEALAYSHEQGVIHRDVKPANLMLSRGGRCKLADFGLAVLRNPGSDGKGHRGPAGTPQFVAPELARGEEGSPLSDIYSLGGTLWYLLVGKPPFSGQTAGELLEKHMNEPLPDLATLCPQLPETLVRGLYKALDKNPAKRFENAEQFARLLRVHTIPVGPGSSMSGLAALAASRGFSVPPTVAKPAGLSKSVIWGGLAALVGTGVLGASIYWVSGGWSKQSLPPPPDVPHLAVLQAAAHVGAAAPPVVIAPGKVIAASDTSLLNRLAAGHTATQLSEHVAVEGTVASNQVSKHAKYFRISFVGAEGASGFVCTYKAELLPALQQKFAGADGLGLQGKVIRVTGGVQMYKDRPAIELESPSQIELLQPATAPINAPTAESQR